MLLKKHTDDFPVDGSKLFVYGISRNEIVVTQLI